MDGRSLHLTLAASILIVHFLQPSAASFDLDSFRLTNPNISFTLNASLVFNITADFAACNQTLYFILENNNDLVPRDISVQYLSSQGQTRAAYGSDHGVQYAKGSVKMGSTPEKSEEVGWARLMIDRNMANVSFSGTLTIMQNLYEVEPKFGDNGSAWMLCTKHEERDFNNRCPTSPAGQLLKRQSWNQGDGSNWTASIGNTYGCPGTRRIAYVGIMTDCSFTASFNSSSSAQQYILNMVNTASVVFESSFNISLGVRNLTISDADCPTSSSEMTAWNAPCSQGNLNARFQAFSRWRNSIDDTNAYWTLLTGCSVTVGEIGVSWIGALCSSGTGYSNGVASANVVARTQSEWQVFAHESGHMFGAVHDCTADTCLSDASQCCPLSSHTCDAAGRYIMNPISEQSMTRFSPCTIGTICSRLGSGQVDSSCLVESQTRNTEQCGNGIVESGESCDCGNGACDEQESRCCDSITCQYREADGCSHRSNTRDNGDNNDSGSLGNNSTSWTQRNLPIIIGACAGVGGALLLLLLGGLLYSSRCVRRPNGATAE